MPKYGNKNWRKVGRGAQSNEQFKVLDELIEKHKDGAVTATLEETGKPVIIEIEGQAKAISVTAKGTVTEIDKPKAPVAETAAA